MVGAGTLVALGCMLACGLGSRSAAIGGLVCFSLAHGLTNFNVYAIGQPLAGPSAAAKWMGLQCGIGNIAGIVSPWRRGR